MLTSFFQSVIFFGAPEKSPLWVEETPWLRWLEITVDPVPGPPPSSAPSPPSIFIRYSHPSLAFCSRRRVDGFAPKDAIPALFPRLLFQSPSDSSADREAINEL